MSTSNYVIAFDLDDTLYDERDYVNACIEHVADYCSKTFGLNLDTIIADMHSMSNPYDGLQQGIASGVISIDEFLKIYRSTQPNWLPMRADATELLTWLHNNRPDIPLYLITDGRSVGQRAKIEALQLYNYFERSHIFISEERGHDKNTAIPFMMAMNNHTQPCKWIYIGDNPAKDFHWPNHLGWNTVMIANRGRNVHKQDLTVTPSTDYHPHSTLHLLTDIIPLIK